jgi:hypothetical protein
MSTVHHCMPQCMKWDGAEPCKGYQALQAELEAVETLRQRWLDSGDVVSVSFALQLKTTQESTT